MPKASKNTQGKGSKNKLYALPSAQKKRDLGVPKFQAAKGTGKQAMPYGKSKAIPGAAKPTPASMAAVAAMQQEPDEAGPSSGITFAPIDSSLMRDSSSRAFMRELRKVIERSDVIIQVLDSRDPEGTRSRWVEEEVRKRDMDGKKLLGVMNKIDLVPRANLEAWMKHLKHSFPVMPFKSSTQSQRNNLSQNAVPIATPASAVGLGAGQTAPAPALPTTSSSLGAPALLHLLKQYALSTPHSSLTVGVVGYPNVGKSSLINSLKRSRACAVAAMPGKTRVVQEVVLDKGVKIVDCPGVVLEDIARETGGEEGRRKQAEIMLRNCIKAELVEDPIAPVEVILSKVDPLMLQKLYNIPPYNDVRDFLIRIALVRGRLGKGGIPDLEGSAVSILRDWNTGKIPYFTIPPAVHASSMPSATVAGAPRTEPSGDGGDVEMSTQVGDAKILNNLSEAFTIDGLFDSINDEAAWEGEEEEEGMEEDDGGAAWEAEEAAEEVASIPVPIAPAPTLFKMDDSDASDVSDDEDDNDITCRPARPAAPLPVQSTISTESPAQSLDPVKRVRSSHNPLFTKEELAVLSPSVIDRAKLKQQAKKAKKRQMAQAKTEGELMYGMMGMDVEHQEPLDMSGGVKVSARQLKKDKKRARDARERQLQQAAKATPKTETGGMELDVDAQMDQKKEADFAAFLANVGADSDEEL